MVMHQKTLKFRECWVSGASRLYGKLGSLLHVFTALLLQLNQLRRQIM